GGQVFLDGRELGEDFTPTWFGYSTGKWEGDTLVVDTRGFNGKAWIDQAGRPTTEALHVTERFQRKDFGHMEVQITIDDPKAYTKPWTVTEKFNLVTNSDLLEFICENNRDLEHLPPSSSKCSFADGAFSVLFVFAAPFHDFSIRQKLEAYGSRPRLRVRLRVFNRDLIVQPAETRTA